ncbi:hypothetical protein LSCM4_02575 [Leishmania orientalis]|uniref:Uncharacterized protein n=1 Tax=Leishmania orientalis TaxID=2249476 RepID=A0A836KE48_9TRYP|nr:hypothetical protein LSCM4_02575 [Leishmania orientalis]
MREVPLLKVGISVPPTRPPSLELSLSPLSIWRSFVSSSPSIYLCRCYALLTAERERLSLRVCLFSCSSYPSGNARADHRTTRHAELVWASLERGWSARRPSPLSLLPPPHRKSDSGRGMHRTEEATTRPTERFAAHRRGADVPRWLRRSYTRTIPSEIRTTEQLQLSFEDVREQWWDLCEAYTRGREEFSCQTKHPAEEVLPGNTRSAVDRLVSQLKSVKQELLAHLSRLSGALTTPSVPPPSGALDLVLPEWASDLMGNSAPSNVRAVRLEHGSEAMKSYLQAIWLARRVWAWSLCFAIVSMDLELLSGSVSVAAELFFGNPFLTAVTLEPSEADRKKAADLALDSAYNRGGLISEALLYGTVAAAASTISDEPRAGSAPAGLHDTAVPLQISARLTEEACEIAAFFGCSVSSAKSAAGSVGRASSTHADPHAAAVEGEVDAPLPKTSAAPKIRDIFWVHAAALCYSVAVRDDASAARLLSVFETAKHSLVAEEAESSAGEDAATCSILTRAPEHPNPSEKASELQTAIVFVLLLAKLIVDEDYSALTKLLHCAGFSDDGDGRAADEGQDWLSTSLAAVSPEGAILRFLIRLLAEHVVRRRWTEHGLGQAFQPMEPCAVGAGAAMVGPDQLDSSKRHRLVCALASRVSLVDTARRAQLNNLTGVMKLVQGTRHLCNALQMAALRNMGGDWPLPPALLRSTFS